MTNYHSNELLTKFPDGQSIITAYNPDRIVQLMQLKDRRRIFLGDSPTLWTMRDTYGTTVAESWIEIQIQYLSQFTGVSDSVGPLKRSVLATLILSEWGYLKMSEFMFFIGRTMTGLYGAFYGNVDPMDIAVFLKKFVHERNIELSILEEKELRQQQEEERERWKRDAITYQQWQAIKAKAKDKAHV